MLPLKFSSKEDSQPAGLQKVNRLLRTSGFSLNLDRELLLNEQEKINLYVLWRKLVETILALVEVGKNIKTVTADKIQYEKN